jgi:hypothetical protein
LAKFGLKHNSHGDGGTEDKAFEDKTQMPEAEAIAHHRRQHQDQQTSHHPQRAPLSNDQQNGVGQEENEGNVNEFADREPR